MATQITKKETRILYLPVRKNHHLNHFPFLEDFYQSGQNVFHKRFAKVIRIY